MGCKLQVMSDNQPGALAIELGQKLASAELAITTVESCTGGWIAKCLTDVPGSSGWFEQGFVTYSNAAKSDLVGVPAWMLESYGAVSADVVIAMADGALRRSSADIAVAVSGVAGPEGGSDIKPVGTVWLAWARRHGKAILCTHKLEHFSGDRNAVRLQTVMVALAGSINLIN